MSFLIKKYDVDESDWVIPNHTPLVISDVSLPFSYYNCVWNGITSGRGDCICKGIPDFQIIRNKSKPHKVAYFKGYTGKPIYSVWYGSESERRAIFVDEVKCIGCLKCTLFAENTFAIEFFYGRARVIAQWADSEYKIQEAIEAWPVDCISMVERSKLAALEFLMSKQPRGNVRIGAGNTVGSRV
ncbi:hypothetical protein L2E82_11369 [Cichorium intybus]|uniref:Uncharacterized protein n=1 Tax=Cichorium intybus TaxID=13427 RepID=A0ACB9GDR0_CICIN|nr:hypothetical protein L2E82_11369 [Cichorium intybus]